MGLHRPEYVRVMSTAVQLNANFCFPFHGHNQQKIIEYVKIIYVDIQNTVLG